MSDIIGSMPRALWAKAPLALLRHRVGLFAVVGASLLVGIGAAAGPLMNAGVDSEALQSKLAQMTPLAAGLSIERPADRDPGDAEAIAARDRRRRRAAVALGLTLPSVGPPVLTTSTFSALLGRAFALGNQVLVVPMARTNATAHVHRVDGDGAGAWLSSSVMHRAGGVVAFGAPSPGAGLKVSLRVGAIYRALADDLGNPYWVNFTARIRSFKPDPPPLPTFALVSTSQLYRVAYAAGGSVGNDFEFPLAVGSMTPGRAKRIARSFEDVKQRIASRSGLAERLGCASVSRPCAVSSELTAAVQIANAGNSSLRPVIDLLAAFCSLVALGAALIVGVFTGRRRAAEARLSLVGGEPRALFFARAGIESLLPSLCGAAAGLAVAVETVRLFTPDGSIDNSVVSQVAVRVALSALASVCVFALGLTIARGRLGVEARRRRFARLLLWEAFLFAGAAAAWVVLDAGGGLVNDRVSGSHPRLIVLLLPALVAAPLTGIAIRLLRARVLRRVGIDSVVGFLALRRVAAARGLLVALTVAIAVGTASLGFAEILDSSLKASTTEKAFVSNGSDVQGLIEPTRDIPSSFPYPASKVAQVFAAGQLDSGQTFDLMVVDPPSLARVLAPHWSKPVRSAVQALETSDASLPAIAVGIDPGEHFVTLAGQRDLVRVVARVRAFPGMQPTQPFLVVPSRALGRSPTGALNYVWATGPPAQVEAALAHSSLAPQYLTAVAQFSRNPAVENITRTYSFLRLVAIGLVLLSLAALLLYLNARQRSQLVTAAFLRRMGLSQPRQALSVARIGSARCARGRDRCRCRTRHRRCDRRTCRPAGCLLAGAGSPRPMDGPGCLSGRGDGRCGLPRGLVTLSARRSGVGEDLRVG